MKTFTFKGGLGDLGQFGIFALTGEACALGTRVLCDLNATGRKVIMAALGIPDPRYAHGGIQPDELTAIPFAENWNHGHEDAPHVASIMLSLAMAQDIAVIGMFEVHGCEAVMVFGSPPDSQWRTTRMLEGLRLEGGEGMDVIEACADEHRGGLDIMFQRLIRPIGQPRRGLQCVHAMTGRSL